MPGVERSITHQGTDSGTDALRHFPGFVGRDQFFHQQQAKIDRRAGPAGRQQVAVGHDSLAAQDSRQFVRDGKMGGVSSTNEKPGIMQHGGSGADGREPTPGGMVTEHQRANPGIGAEVFYTRPAGQEQTVEITRFHGREGRVGVQGHAGAAGHMDALGERGDGDLDPRPAQQVDRCDGFNFLKTLRQDCENRGHGVSLGGMSPDAHGNLSGRRLVILGCGYVGSELARQAVARGMKVSALTRNAVAAAELSAAGVETVTTDLAGDDWHARIPGGAEFVLNCVSSGGRGVENYRRSYVDGMRSALAWARRGPVGTFVFTGSTSVYPQGGGAIVDETASTDGAGETARVLLEAEALLASSVPSACARWFVLRLAGIYGPGRHHLLDQLRAGATEIAGRGDHRLNLIHRDDIVAAIWAAFTAPPAVAGEIFNAADDGAATKVEIAAWLTGKIRVPAPRFTGVSGTARRTVTPDRVINNGKLRSRLGWRPAFPTFREGYAGILGAL